MRIQTEYMSFNNRWTISSSYDFPARQQCSLRRCWFSQSALLWFEVLSQACRRRSEAGRQRTQTCRWVTQMLPGAPDVLSGTPRCSQIYLNHSQRTPVPVIRELSYSKGRPECPPRVWYSPELDPSKFTLRILSDTPGGSQWLKYILLMWIWCLIAVAVVSFH